MSYYSQPESHITNRINVELDLSNYPTKSDLKGVAYAKTSNLTVREDLPSLKVRVDKLDVDKLKTVLADLSSITNVIDNNVLKNVVYDKLVINVNTIDTKITNIGLFSEMQYDSDKQNSEKKIEGVDKKIPNTKNLVNKMLLIQRLQILKINCLTLAIYVLILSSVQRLQSLKRKFLIFI